jgi:hypothetical protein
MALDTGNTTSPGPEIPTVSADSLRNGYNYGIDITDRSYIPSANGAYTGTLSAHGSITAMQLNQGGYKVVYTGFFRNIGEGLSEPDYTYEPWLTGFLREYWRDPKSCTFGSDSAIPALTGVMPARFTQTPGNALYYIDLQMTRLSGSNFFNNSHFINSFNQALAWIQSSNQYLAALKNIENNNLNYYGSKTYQEFLTQGFSNYAIGQALRLSLRNIGRMVEQIPSSYFGTANAVAKQLLDSGLGSIGQLTTKLANADINISDIYNPIYTNQIVVILESINNQNDLRTIQGVLKSSVPNISNAYDFVSIERTSGRSNDSIFTTLADFGRNIYQRSPGFNLTTGKELADLIDSVLSQATQNVEALATQSSLLPPEITASFRLKLPESPTGGTVNILNVIGCASGYLLDQLTQVNEAINQLNSTSYKTQLHDAFRSINNAFNGYLNSYNPGSTEFGISPGYDFRLESEFNTTKSQYYTLVSTIANDPAMQTIVSKINSNWDNLCENLSYEVINYNKANLDVSEYTDNSQILDFVSSLPSYANDPGGLGTDFFLYNLCQANQAGDIVKSILNEAKNNEKLANSGVKIRGTV